MESRTWRSELGFAGSSVANPQGPLVKENHISLMMSPMFVWLMVVRDPLGVMPTYFSFFPPATPTVMMLRLATGQAIPWWQPVMSIVIMTVSTILIVIVAARIFRVGILWQGKTPKLGEILKWAITG